MQMGAGYPGYAMGPAGLSHTPVPIPPPPPPSDPDDLELKDSAPLPETIETKPYVGDLLTVGVSHVPSFVAVDSLF